MKPSVLDHPRAYAVPGGCTRHEGHLTLYPPYPVAPGGERFDVDVHG
jgi:hypothetical protein